MKALTICQPYADMIAKGEKIIENRTWPAPPKMIGQRIAIHAGKSKAWMEPEDLEERPDMVFGAVVATAELVACLHVSRLPIHLSMRPDANGPWCWILDQVNPLDPVPAKGAQGLWDWVGRSERERAYGGADDPRGSTDQVTRTPSDGRGLVRGRA